MRWMLGCLITAVCLFTVGQSTAATVEPLTLGQLADLSERIFIGTVTHQVSHLQHTPLQIFTQTTFQIEMVLKGDKSTEPFTLVQLGGSVGEGSERIGQKISGYATFEEGERVVLFLERIKSGRLVVAGLAQGKFTLRQDPKSGEYIAERSVADLHFHGGRTTPRAFAGTPETPDRMRLSNLIRVIRGEAHPQRIYPKVVHPQTRQVTLPAPEGAR